MSPRADSGGPKVVGSGDGSADVGDPRWVVRLKRLTGASSVSSERLDVAKGIFILLVCAGHLCEPFYKIQNKPTQAFMHVIYGFHVPAFVLISGYVSGDLNAKRRRALISGVVAPFLILHVLFSVSYTKMFCEGDAFDAFERGDTPGRPRCELVNHWALLDKDHGAWDGWDRWTFAYPFAQLWYLVSLFTKRIWRPFALEMRWTLLVHVILGVTIGYTTIGRFLSIHRSAVHMPYFLCGYLMKKHACFFPEQTAAPARRARSPARRRWWAPRSSRRTGTTCAWSTGSRVTRTTPRTARTGRTVRCFSSSCTPGRSSRWRLPSRSSRGRRASACGTRRGRRRRNRGFVVGSPRRLF